MKAIQWIISALVAVVIIAAAVGGGVYFTRLKSIHSIQFVYKIMLVYMSCRIP